MRLKTQANWRLINRLTCAIFLLLTLTAAIESAQAELIGYGPNLIANADFEQQTSDGKPSGWAAGRWGQNTAVFSYPVSGQNGSKSAKITITSRVTGDAKWYHADAPIIGGREYQYTDYYQADTPSTITVRFALIDGSYRYSDLAVGLAPTAEFAPTAVSFIAPTDATSVSVFHLINSVGWLTIDNCSLREMIDQPDGNLIKNPSVENMQGLNPAYWSRGRWGVNETVFSYPVAGFMSPRGVQVEMTSRSSGDAKWYFADTPVIAGNFYTFEDDYISTTGSIVTVRYAKTDGSYVYNDLAILPPTPTWRHFGLTLKIPDGVASMTIFHLINSIGRLTTDNYVIRETETAKFPEGLVSLNFDDGSRTIYYHAIPRLDAAGFKSTQYIVTKYMENLSGYMKPDELLELKNNGHEIASHSVDHSDLRNLTPEEISYQLGESKRILQRYGFDPKSFAYPYGYHTGEIEQALADHGYLAGRATFEGFNIKDGNPYSLKIKSVTAITPFSQIAALIDQAMADKSWLIISFHRIDYSGDSDSHCKRWDGSNHSGGCQNKSWCAWIDCFT